MKFDDGLQRYLLTCQANSALLVRFLCTGQQQLWRPLWNLKIISSRPLFIIIFKPIMLSNLRKNFLCIVWHQKPTVNCHYSGKVSCFSRLESGILIGILEDFWRRILRSSAFFSLGILEKFWIVCKSRWLRKFFTKSSTIPIVILVWKAADFISYESN